MIKTTTHTRVIDGTTVHVDLEGGPRPSFVIRAMMGMSAILLVAPVIGVPFAIVTAIAWVIHRIGEKQRVEAIINDAARQAAGKYENSRILAYKSLG